MSIAAWLFGAVIVAAALGMVFSRELIHSALWLLMVMIGVAVEYAVLGAPFVFAVQMVVYAGAIMVMILFIVMMVGSHGEADDREPMKAQRPLAILAALMVLGLIVFSVYATKLAAPAGVNGSIANLGELIFTRYVVIFEVLSALLIVAAVGAMVLIFRTRRPGGHSGQREASIARFANWAEHGTNVGAKAGAGVYASTNAMDVPALLPDGSELESSVSGDLVKRHDVHSAGAIADHTARNYRALDDQQRGE